MAIIMLRQLQMITCKRWRLLRRIGFTISPGNMGFLVHFQSVDISGRSKVRKLWSVDLLRRLDLVLLSWGHR